MDVAIVPTSMKKAATNEIRKGDEKSRDNQIPSMGPKEKHEVMKAWP